MTIALKKLSFALILITTILVVILIGQINDARIISTKVQQIPLISPVSVNIPITGDDFILGNPGAPLTVVAFLNFADRQSLRDYRTISALVNKNPKKMRLLVKHYPSRAFFSNPLLVHQAALCAGKQGRYWTFLNDVAESKHTLRQTQLTDLAENNQLSMTAWTACLSDEATNAAIQKDLQIVNELILPAAPVIFINNKLLNPEEAVDLTQLLTTFITTDL